MSKIEEYTKIVSFLKEYGIENATINDDFTVDVNGSVSLSRKKLYKIPIQFRRVNGSFYCSFNRFTTLEGCPEYVSESFSCLSCELKSLKGCPKYVGGDFSCNYNSDLKSLKGIGKVNGIIYSDFFEGKLEDYKGEL